MERRSAKASLKTVQKIGESIACSWWYGADLLEQLLELRRHERALLVPLAPDAVGVHFRSLHGVLDLARARFSAVDSTVEQFTF